MMLPRSIVAFAWSALLAWVLLSACGGKGPELPRLGPEDVILAFGDSLTFGTGANEEESYPEVLATLIGRKVVRAGVPGEVTTQGVRRLAQALDAHNPKIVLLCLGGNDMLRRVDDKLIVANLREMVAIARQRGAAVVLLGVPRPALFGGAATFYADIADDAGLAYEGEVVNAVLRDPALKSDPIHPNALGYRRIAERIAALLKERGAL
jgi:lysophospholipase L1-like esterase